MDQVRGLEWTSVRHVRLRILRKEGLDLCEGSVLGCCNYCLSTPRDQVRGLIWTLVRQVGLKLVRWGVLIS